jgi:phage shock protein A
MGIFKRIKNLIKSNADDLIDKAEDPEKVLNQSIVDMSERLVSAKKQVADSISTERRLAKQTSLEIEKTEGWKEKAAIAVRAGDDELAKLALARKREHAELATQYGKQWQDQKNAVAQLKVTLRTLSDKIEEAKRKKNVLVAKKKRVDAQREMQDTIGALNDDGAMQTFERMEQKILRAEAEAESVSELSEERSGDKMDQKFAELQAASGEDMDLLALKEELGLLEGKHEEDEAAGQLEGNHEADEVSSELETMKSKLGNS